MFLKNKVELAYLQQKLMLEHFEEKHNKEN